MLFSDLLLCGLSADTSSLLSFQTLKAENIFRFKTTPRVQPTPLVPEVQAPVAVAHAPLETNHVFLQAAAASLKAQNSPDKFAVIQIHSRQYKVCEEDLVMVDKLEIPVGESVILDRILLLGSAHKTFIGRYGVG